VADRVTARALRRGHWIKLEGRRVHVVEVNHTRLPGFVEFQGRYYTPDEHTLTRLVSADRVVTIIDREGGT
jgi:hypothetical protein